MLNTSPLANSQPPAGGLGRAPRKARKSLIPFLILWLFLIGAGVAGTYEYTEHLQEQISSKLQLQTAKQIQDMQLDYQSRLDKLETDYSTAMVDMQSKVETLNELLTFNKDNANDKTDNSNKLYTQISELKKQLDQLKKELDLLK